MAKTELLSVQSHYNPSMRIFHIPPTERLRPYIDRYWGWESVRDEVVSLPTLLPGTGAELFLHYRTPFCRSAAHQANDSLGNTHLLCMRRTTLALREHGDIGFVAIRFRAGMLHRFTNIPGHSMADQVCSVDDLWGADGKELAERVAGVELFSAKARLIDAFLLKRLRSGQTDQLVELAASRIYRDGSAISIDHLASQLGLGRRQLERRFKAQTGQSPVEARRISRFQKVVRALMLDHSASCLDTALSHGYYDQAHFIRDFKELAMTTPQRYIEAARTKTHFYNPSWRAGVNMTAPITHMKGMSCFYCLQN